MSNIIETTARQLLPGDIGKIVEFSIFQAALVEDMFVSGKLTEFDHFAFRDGREPKTTIKFESLATGKTSRVIVDDSHAVTIKASDE